MNNYLIFDILIKWLAFTRFEFAILRSIKIVSGFFSTERLMLPITELSMSMWKRREHISRKESKRGMDIQCE